MVYASTIEYTGVQSASAQSIGEWREVAGSRFVPLHVVGGPGFSGSIRWRFVEGTCLSEIAASAHRVLRMPALISPDDPKHYKITLLVKGSGLVAQDGRQSVLRPGDLAIYDTSRPYMLEFTEDVHCLVMAFPQDAFDVPDSLIRRITAVRLSGDTGVGAMISPFMRHLSENLDTLDGVAGMRILHSSLDLLTALVYAQLSEDQDHWGQARQVEMRRIKLFIDAHLHQPDLNAVQVAKSHYMSVRQLQYLFRAENITVSGYIRARRLEQCRVALTDPAQASLSILEIAQRWGFTDASHFSKVFRAAYGVTPRDLRMTRFGD